jgi:phage terminase large subunit
VLADTKTTLLKTFEEVLNTFELECTPSINPRRPEQIYTVLGCEFAFFGIEESGKLHGREQDYAWINEALEVDRKSFDQLEMRTRVQVVLDFNPWDQDHWIFNLQKRDDAELFVSTVLDNPFAPPAIRKKILGYEPTPFNYEQGTADEYMWQVYGLGMPARLEGVIFLNWEEIKSVPDEAHFLGYGLDFGFTNDPAALYAVYRWNGGIIADQVIYETGLLNSDIVDKMRHYGVDPRDLIIADCAEPKSIEEIKRSGFLMIKPAMKGRDSIKYSIDLLAGVKIYVTTKSYGLLEEIKKYKWKVAKDGRALNEPVDEFNHAIDALRYLAMEVLQKKGRGNSQALSPEYQGGKYWLEDKMPTPEEIINESVESLGARYEADYY